MTTWRNSGNLRSLSKRALEGYEVQLGKDHEDMKLCARNFSMCLKASGNSKRLAELKEGHRGWMRRAAMKGRAKKMKMMTKMKAIIDLIL